MMNSMTSTRYPPTRGEHEQPLNHNSISLAINRKLTVATGLNPTKWEHDEPGAEEKEEDEEARLSCFFLYACAYKKWRQIAAHVNQNRNPFYNTLISAATYTQIQNTTRNNHEKIGDLEDNVLSCDEILSHTRTVEQFVTHKNAYRQASTQ
uniref:Uncharacterized protein n=1 Tax=Glossina pallidipes TaxID=7398 RepID=A0A1A9Z3Z1_GLOPL